MANRAPKSQFLCTKLSKTGCSNLTELITWRHNGKRYATVGAGAKYTLLLSYINDLNYDIDTPPN